MAIDGQIDSRLAAEELSSPALRRALRMMGGEILEGRADPAGLSALAEVIFPGEDISDPRFIRWMYEENPGGRAIEYASLNAGRVVGHVAALPYRYKFGDRTLTAGLVINAITHPDFRGKGVFMVLTEILNRRCGRAGIEFTFGYANSNSEKGCLRHLAYKELGRFPLWILPFRPARIADAQDPRPPAWLRAAARLAGPGARAWAFVRRPLFRRGITVEAVREIGPEFDALWESARGGYGNILVRDRAFLDWRFHRAPTRRYEILAARKHGRLVGYLASTTTPVQGLRWAMIMDMLVADSREGRAAAARLVEAHVRRARAAGADLAAGLMFRHAPAAAGLRRNGFLVASSRLLPRDFPILLHWNLAEKEPETLFDLKSWYLTMGDYDAA